jgi:YlmC/YmxH family sporulation protein
MSDLQRKDIINTKTGVKLGKIVDINVNNEGLINYLVVEPIKVLKRVSLGNEIKITFKDIVTIGSDVILVNIN